MQRLITILSSIMLLLTTGAALAEYNGDRLTVKVSNGDTSAHARGGFNKIKAIDIDTNRSRSNTSGGAKMAHTGLRGNTKTAHSNHGKLIICTVKPNTCLSDHAKP